MILRIVQEWLGQEVPFHQIISTNALGIYL